MTRPFFLALQLILLFLLFNPFFFLLLGTIFTSYDMQRIVELFILGLAALQLLCDAPLRQHTIQILENFCTYKKCLVFGFFILGVLSALHALYPLYALLEVGTFFALFMFALCIAGWYSLEQDIFLRKFEFFILFTFSVNAITALMSIVYLKNHPELINPNAINSGSLANFLASPGYINRRFFDDGQVFLIPLLLAFFFFKSSRLSVRLWKQALIFLVVSFCFARGFLDGSRIYLVEPILLFIILPLLFRKKALPYLGLLLATLLVGGILYFAVYQWNFDFSTQTAGIPGLGGLGVPEGRTLLNHRGLLWDIAANLVKLHPLLGVGPLHFGLYAFATETYAAHPHSAILALAAEWGLPAIVLLAILVIGAIYNFCRKLQEPNITPDSLASRLGVTGALIGGLAMMQIDGLIRMPVGQMMLALTLGWAMAIFYGPQNASTFAFRSTRFMFCVMLAFIIAIAVIIWAVLPMASNLPYLTTQYLSSCAFACQLSPDYWSQGFIQFYQH